jgi:hypothetical protein
MRGILSKLDGEIHFRISASNRSMKAFLSVLLFASLACAADVANMSGAWKLNVAKSKFDKNAAPLNVLLKIEHNEPSLKYSGSVTGSQEGQTDTFEFDGAIDEKIYPVKENADTGRTIKFKRKSDRAVESWSSDRNGTEQYAVTEISGDGKTLIRTVHVKLDNGGRSDWTEFYDKQN